MSGDIVEGDLPYKWHHLAQLIPCANADPDRINAELNAIYLRAINAQLAERDPDAKTTRRQLERLWNSFDKLSRPARRILAAQLRQDMGEAGIPVPDALPDREL